MKAMLLAAGRGERMRPLTDEHPKPLLMAGGKPLIVWHLEKLAAAGFAEVIINHAWLGEQIPATLGDGNAFGLKLRYSAEPEALETAGGIAKALPMLTEGEADDAPFAVISSDAWSDADYSCLPEVARMIRTEGARCWCLMVDNPGHHQRGDFMLQDGHLKLAEPPAGEDAAINPHASASAETTLTYAGIGVFTPSMFAQIPAGTRSPLRPWLEDAIRAGLARGHYHRGIWFDIGTPARLAELDRRLLSRDGQPSP
ncbi:MAG: nucleotidyltransferase family protein [Lautropia sp.]|nr:nucleotidyltransferase family protein [Lautropia sp.]